jgi:hypothetical protein
VSEDVITDTTQPDLKYLTMVLEYRNRTVAVIFVKNSEQLEKSWEEAQFELGTRYQYPDDNERIWDYYLAICCAFDESSLLNELRFKIENDRFCCRKVFIFNSNPKKSSSASIIGQLFPQIQGQQKIEILEPSKFIPSLNTSKLITKEFFTRTLDDDEIDNLAKSLIAESILHDKNRKN